MNLFGLNISLNRNSKPGAQKSGDETPVSRLSPEVLAWLAGQDSGPPSPSLHNAYEQVVWVYRAINVLAEQVANIPFLFSHGQRGRETLITSGPLHDFYNHPHPSLNRFQYWEMRVLWLMLRGECMRVPIYQDRVAQAATPARSYQGESIQFAAPMTLSPRAAALDSSQAAAAPAPVFTLVESHLKTRTSKLKAVLMVDPAYFQHVIEQRQLIGWRCKVTSPNSPIDPQVFLPGEVWFDRLPNPFDFWRGLPPLLVAELAAKTDFAASCFMRDIIDNNAENGLIVRTEQQLTPEQREQIAAEIRRRSTSRSASGRSVLLWGANEVIQPRISSADLQFLQNRKFTRSEICAAFGVPEEILTSTDHAKYDVMQGARLNFIENRVAPLCARLEAEEQALIRSIDPEAIGWFDLDSLPIMQQARRSRLAAAKTGFDMGLPLNELNRLLDLGFEPLPWGDTGFLPSTLLPVGQAFKKQHPLPNSSNGTENPALPADVGQKRSAQ